MKRYGNRCLFTLIELLIVIAVIAILAGMLLPALGRAKRSAHGTHCTQNIHQLASVYLYYSNDNQEILPCFDNLGGSSAGLTQKNWLNGMIRDYLKRANASVEPVEVLFCPLETETEDITTTYGINYNIAASNGEGIPISTFKKPSSTGMLVENTGHPCYSCSALNPLRKHDRDSYANNRAAFFRHEDKASAAFLDGHVRLMGRREIPCLESYPGSTAAVLKNTYFNTGKKDPSRETIDSL